MEIIKNNNTIDVACEHCESILAITKEDILDYEMSGTYIRCLACGRITTIPIQLIPKDWWNYIEEI